MNYIDKKSKKEASSGLRILRVQDPWADIGADVKKGLTSDPKYLHCKYFYDQKGSELFDAICELPEYYLTRSEASLLSEIAPEIARLTQVNEIIELGSGVASKTTLLLDAFTADDCPITYRPLDISEAALRQAILRLKGRYKCLNIEAVVCDYTQDLESICPNSPCLAVFIGSTIGNFDPPEAVELLKSLRRRLEPGDWFLLGADLLKSKKILEAAYNDKRGLTALFNKNILQVINTRLGGLFDPDDFRHRAFLNTELQRIEMHLEAKKPLEIFIRDLGLTVAFRKGETIFTEISRKFTKEGVHGMMKTAGFQPERWYVSRDGYFVLTLAQVK